MFLKPRIVLLPIESIEAVFVGLLPHVDGPSCTLALKLRVTLRAILRARVCECLGDYPVDLWVDGVILMNPALE